MNEIRFPKIERLQGTPNIVKSGILTSCGGECSVFVRRGQLLRLENEWSGFDGVQGPCAVLRDYFTGELLAVVGSGEAMFYSAFCENARVYVFATQKNSIF